MDVTLFMTILKDEFGKEKYWHCDCGEDHDRWDGIAFRATKRYVEALAAKEPVNG